MTVMIIYYFEGGFFMFFSRYKKSILIALLVFAIAVPVSFMVLSSPDDEAPYVSGNVEIGNEVATDNTSESPDTANVGLATHVEENEENEEHYVLFHEDFENGSRLASNADVDLELSTNAAASGTTSLRVAPTHVNNWSGVALRNDSLESPMLPSGGYRLTANLFSEENTVVGIRVETVDGAGNNTWGTVANTRVSLTAGQWSQVTMDFTIPIDHQVVNAILFHNDAQIQGLVFYLDDVLLVMTEVPISQAVDIENDPWTELLTFDFGDQGESERLFTTVGSASQITWVDGAGVDGQSALRVNNIPNTSFVSFENAIRLTLDERLPRGGVYNISVWVKAPVEGNEGKGTLTGPGLVLNQDYAGDVFKLPSNAANTQLVPGEWFEVNVNTPMMMEHMYYIDFRLVTNNEENHANVWYISNIEINRIGALQQIQLPEWDLRLPSLAEVYSDFFIFGNILEPHEINNIETVNMFLHHYRVVTAENSMKPGPISSGPGVFSLDNADRLVDWAIENDIYVHGHVLVWHSQSAPWLTNHPNGDPLTRDEARDNMELYINTVAGHFRGRIRTWDVVNEIFDGGTGIPEDWRDPDVIRTNSAWYIAFSNGADPSLGESGADFVYDAFVFARLADPYAILYYNDYNETQGWRREVMAMMAEDLNERWRHDPRNTDPDRLLVEGLGMQSHYWVDNLNVDEVHQTLRRFIDAGVQVSITELDIPLGTFSNQHDGSDLSDEQALVQAMLYAELFEVYKRYANYIDRVIVWGKADPQSWRAAGLPLMFDRLFQAKPAFYAVLDPRGFLVSNWNNRFTDVTPDHPFYEDILYVSATHIMNGSTLNTFGVDENVTWGHMATILYRFDGQRGVSRVSVSNAIAHEWAIATGIFPADFDPDAYLARQDMAVIITSYLAYRNRGWDVAATNRVFEDNASIAPEASSAVQFLYASGGIMTARENNNFEPTAYVNRAEMAAAFSRVVTAIQESNRNS